MKPANDGSAPDAYGIVIIDRNCGNIRFNVPNQINAMIGKQWQPIYVGERCGTIRATVREGHPKTGKTIEVVRCFDWWVSETEEAAPGWPKVILVPAE